MSELNAGMLLPLWMFAAVLVVGMYHLMVVETERLTGGPRSPWRGRINGTAYHG